jgi:signal peptidase I
MLPETVAYPDAPPLRMLAEPGRPARGRAIQSTMLSSILPGGVVLAVLVVILGMVLGLWRFTVINTGSMRPTLAPGDVAVLTSESTNDLKQGQIVAFHPPGEPQLTVLHRVFSIHRVHNGVIIQTKGDANNTTDQWHARITANTIWRESVKAPKVGYLVVWSHQRAVRLGVLILIVTLVVSMLLRTIWRGPPPVRGTLPTTSTARQ